MSCVRWLRRLANNSNQFGRRPCRRRYKLLMATIDFSYYSLDGATRDRSNVHRGKYRYVTKLISSILFQFFAQRDKKHTNVNYVIPTATIQYFIRTPV